MKFKSNGTKAKKPLEHIQKKHFFGFRWGFAWIFMGIKRVLQKKIKNNNMIRLVPMRIESGRFNEGKMGFFIG